MERHSTASSLVSEGPPRHTPTPDDYPEELLPVFRKLLAVIRSINRSDATEGAIDDPTGDNNHDRRRWSKKRKNGKKSDWSSDDGDGCGCCGIVLLALVITAIVFLAKASAGDYDHTFSMESQPTGSTQSAEKLFNYVGMGYLVSEPGVVTESCLESFQTACNSTVTPTTNNIGFIRCATGIVQGVSDMGEEITEECRKEFANANSELDDALRRPAILLPAARIDAFHQCRNDAVEICETVLDGLSAVVDEDDEEEQEWVEKWSSKHRHVSPFDPTHVYSIGKCLLDNRDKLKQDECGRMIDLFKTELELSQDDFLVLYRNYSFVWYNLPSIPDRLLGWLGGAAITVVWGGILATVFLLFCCCCCCCGCLCSHCSDSSKGDACEAGCEKVLTKILESDEYSKKDFSNENKNETISVDLESQRQDNVKNDSYVVAKPI